MGNFLFLINALEQSVEMTGRGDRFKLVRFANETTRHYLHNEGDARQYSQRMQITDYHKGLYDACAGCSVMHDVHSMHVQLLYDLRSKN